ncbi:MAG: hypothetical protein IJ563_00300 [Selenomonadaceae bacterium]|nr:hypothetical protein [Selenomonadaceae bacterium]MBR1857915.1 hypothetical protein [Selenomonadaceae bacterium]
MKRYKVAIVSTGEYLESILAAIDFDNLEFCALFGIWETMSEKCQNLFKTIFQPLDMLSTNCHNCGAEYFLINFPPGDSKIKEKLISKGIDKEKICIMDLFGHVKQFNISYSLQWHYLINKNPKLDFVVTGMSGHKYGVDIKTMQPWRGINFCRDSQDLYYSYKMLESYLNLSVNKLKFCLIGLTPYCFNHLLNKIYDFHRQFYYFPIIKHDQMEYHNTEVGSFLEHLFIKKYKIWMYSWFRALNGQAFDLNDIDGSRHWHQDHYSMNIGHYIDVSDQMIKRGNKLYPETIEYNKDILNKYLHLCHKNNIVPIGLLLPYSQLSKKHYPKKSLQDFYLILEPFLEKMEFINLWNVNLPNVDFEDPIHMKMTGSIKVTKIIKEKVSQILNK